MILDVLDPLVVVGAFVLTGVSAWRSWRVGLVVGAASIWIGLAVWGVLVGALEPDRSAVVDGAWLLTGWVVPPVFVGAIAAVRRTVDDARRRADARAQPAGSSQPKKPTR